MVRSHRNRRFPFVRYRRDGFPVPLCRLDQTWTRKIVRAVRRPISANMSSRRDSFKRLLYAGRNIFFPLPGRRACVARLVERLQKYKIFWLFLPAIYCLKHDIESRRDAFLERPGVRAGAKRRKRRGFPVFVVLLAELVRWGSTASPQDSPRTRVARLPSARAVFSLVFQTRVVVAARLRERRSKRREVDSPESSFMFCLSQNSFQFSY